MSDLLKELKAVLNGHENESDTPDFLLASLVSETLKTWAKIVKARDDWYGFKPWGDNSVTEPTGERKTERSDRELAQIQKQVTLGKIEELKKMPIRSMDDPDDDTNVFWYRTYTMPEYEARLAALQAELEIVPSTSHPKTHFMEAHEGKLFTVNGTDEIITYDGTTIKFDPESDQKEKV